MTLCKRRTVKAGIAKATTLRPKLRKGEREARGMNRDQTLELFLQGRGVRKDPGYRLCRFRDDDGGRGRRSGIATGAGRRLMPPNSRYLVGRRLKGAPRLPGGCARDDGCPCDDGRPHDGGCARDDGRSSRCVAGPVRRRYRITHSDALPGHSHIRVHAGILGIRRCDAGCESNRGNPDDRCHAGVL